MNKPTNIRATVFASRSASIGTLTGLAAFLVASSVFAAYTVGVAAIAIVPIIAFFSFLGLPRSRPRATNVRVTPGKLHIPGMLPIRAADLAGATTARSGEHVSLMLAHSRRLLSPVFLELPNEAALDAVCDKLGIGHHGFGAIDMALQTPPRGVSRMAFSWTTVAAIFFGLLLHLFAPQANVGGLTVMLGILAVSTALQSHQIWHPFVRLTSTGIYVMVGTEYRFIAYPFIDAITRGPAGIQLTVNEPSGPRILTLPTKTSKVVPGGPDDASLDLLVAHIRSAVDRAHGGFVTKEEPGAVVDLLHRQKGETLRTWLSRLDAIQTGGGGYRAMPIDKHDLWTILEDPEAAADLRAGAARVLARVEPEAVRVRIGEVLPTVRDERTRKRIAASLDERLLLLEEQEEESALRPLLK